MRWRVLAVLLLLLGAAAAWNYLRPIPAVAPVAELGTSILVAGSAPALPWPDTGSGAVSVSGLGFIASSGNEQAIPAASVTKVMTALLILEDKPLAKGDAGSTVTMSEVDVQSYFADFANNESVVVVRNGEQLTELQLLEGLLIPSANNYAQTLARWDSGSVAAFVDKMNARAAALHMTHTKFADASGASPQSVSTPSDLLAVGIEAMKQDVFAEIVAMESVVLPVAGTVYNVDYTLGQSGIVGIKTGSGLSSGANFLFAATLTVDSYPVTVYGCVMGLPTLDVAFASARSLIGVMESTLHIRRVIARNQTVASITTPWGAQTDVVSSVDVDLVEWPGMILRQELRAGSVVVDQPIAPGTKEGTEHLVLGDYSLDVPLVTASPLYPPGRLWRLTRTSF
ncbi:MAG: D-alanyl-D-alanine carboxypeptidase family protein [Candidatus Dormibacterales bacterium]